MKKEYIKPEMVVEEIILETMLLADSIISGEGGEGGDGGFGAPGRREGRGTWGNLWDTDEN